MVATGYTGGGGGGGTPSNTVVTETTFGQAATAGASSSYSRGDHTHGTPANPGGSAVSSVFGRTGAVVAANGDYTAIQVGADVSGAAATAQANAIAASAQRASNLSDLASAVTARTNLGLGTAATQSAAAFDAAGAAAAAQAASQPLDGDLTIIAGLTATTDNVIQSVSGSWASRTPTQLKSTLALAKGDVGLGNVDNTSDTNKPVSTAQAAADALAIPKSLVTTKGDLIVATASTTPARLAVGADTFVLTADSAQATGIKWAAGGSGGTILDQKAAIYGLKLAVMESYSHAGAALGASAGVCLMCRVYNPSSQTITKLGVLMRAGGVTASGTNAMGLYDASGVLIDQTTSMSTQFALANQYVEANLGSSQVIATGSYYIAILTHFSGSSPTIEGKVITGSNFFPVNTFYMSVYTTGNTNLPASVTIASANVNDAVYSFWGG